MDYLKVGDKKYAISGYAEDGLPIIKAEVTPFHHKDEQGNQIFDDEGNPKISVHVNVPSTLIGATPGEVS